MKAGLNSNTTSCKR